MSEEEKDKHVKAQAELIDEFIRNSMTAEISSLNEVHIANLKMAYIIGVKQGVAIAEKAKEDDDAEREQDMGAAHQLYQNAGESND